MLRRVERRRAADGPIAPRLPVFDRRLREGMDVHREGMDVHRDLLDGFPNAVELRFNHVLPIICWSSAGHLLAGTCR